MAEVSAYTDFDRIREVAEIRSDYVEKFVARRIDQREGDCTNEEIADWEATAYRIWRNQHPALNSLLPTHLHDGSEVTR